MKKFYIISLLSVALNASAQWQPTNSAASDNGNIYHLGGNVGIGTSIPFLNFTLVQPLLLYSNDLKEQEQAEELQMLEQTMKDLSFLWVDIALLT